MSRNSGDRYIRRFGDGPIEPRPVDRQPGRPDVNPIRNTKGQFVSAAGRERVKGRFVKASAEPVSEVYRPDWARISEDAATRMPKILAHMDARDAQAGTTDLAEDDLNLLRGAYPVAGVDYPAESTTIVPNHKASFDADDFDPIDHYGPAVPEPGKWSPRQTMLFSVVVPALMWGAIFGMIGWAVLIGVAKGWW